MEGEHFAGRCFFIGDHHLEHLVVGLRLEQLKLNRPISGTGHPLAVEYEPSRTAPAFRLPLQLEAAEGAVDTPPALPGLYDALELVQALEGNAGMKASSIIAIHT